MLQFPPRMHETKCLHIYGPTGTGKTRTIMNLLRTLERCYPQLSFYCKGGGLKKWWENYDNQPICIIDDPSCFNVRFSDEDVQAFKTVISSEETTVEIKGGTMQFTSHLVIVVTNPDSTDLARSSGPANYDAVLDRLQGSRSLINASMRVQTPQQARITLPLMLLRIFKQYFDPIFNISICIDEVLGEMPKVIDVVCDPRKE